MEEKEIWRDIAGYEGKYQVSNLGRVRSLNYLHTGKCVVLKPKPYRGGYHCVSLCKDGKVWYAKIHRLVYDAFVGIDKPYIRGAKGKDCWVINHKDENRSNNRLDNLELITQSENVVYGSAIQKQKEKQINNKYTSKHVFQYTQACVLVKEWPSTRECHRNGFDCRRVSECCNGKGKHENKHEYKGFLWYYTNLQTIS